MRKRRPTALQLEQLEARETPDVSLGHAPSASIVPPSQPAIASRIVAQDQGSQRGAVTAIAALHDEPAMPPVADTGILDPQALEHLFFNLDPVDPLLTSSGTTSADVQVVAHAQTAPALPTDSQNLFSGSEDGTVVVTASHADVAIDSGQGWKFLSNYTLKAIRNDELRYGPLRDHEDILQQAFVEWREGIGNQRQAFTNILNRDSAERLFLRKAVRRVIDRARYEQGKQQRLLPLADQPTPVHSSQREWVDLQIDWSHGASRLDPRERLLLELRRQGKTFEEIGSELGMAKQRVFEVYSETIDRLQELYSA
jgi:hypothetical protein